MINECFQDYQSKIDPIRDITQADGAYVKYRKQGFLVLHHQHPLSLQEKDENLEHSSVRSALERDFRMLKNTFGILTSNYSEKKETFN